MTWTKKGLIFCPDKSIGWAEHSALTPTPIIINDYLRIYAGFRDSFGISRIGYVDLDKEDPSKVINVSTKPALDIGRPGSFDDNGVILGDILFFEKKYYMYYVGFQLVRNVKFLAFTGLAVSNDDGVSFERVSEAPIMDRSDEGVYFRAIHSVIHEDGLWKCWYGSGSAWTVIDKKPYPSYTIRYAESVNGVNFNGVGAEIFSFQENEYRIGRPRVIKENAAYQMYFTVGTLAGSYLPGFAKSIDGKEWHRNDLLSGLGPSALGWDSRCVSYMAPIKVNNKEYVFYNGNNMGREGFGFAERKIED